MSDETTPVTDDTPSVEQALPHAALIETIFQKLESFVAERMMVMFNKTDDYLLEVVKKASSIAQQNHLHEFMHELRNRKQGLSRVFLNELKYFLQPIAKTDELPRKKRHQESEELDLIAQDVMDLMVAMTSISSKAAENMRGELSNLEARLNHLGKLNTAIFHDKALEPRVLCDALQETLEFTDFNKDDKLLLYRQFDQEVLKPMHDLYKELNQLLIDEGILPKIDLNKIKRSESREEPVKGSGAQGPGGVQSPGQGGGVAGASVGGGPGGGWGGGTGGGQDAGQGAGGSAGVAMPGAGGTAGHVGGGPAGYAGPGRGDSGSFGAAAGAGHPAGGGSGDQRATGIGYSVGQIRDSIRNFVGGMPSDATAPASGEAGGAGGGGVYYSQNEVVSALTSLQGLQAETDIVHGRRLEFNADAIKKAVLSTIGEKEGGVVTKRVNQVSEKTIDFIKLIFDAIIEEESITDTIKTLLLSLQIPVIKAAMIDADFFVDDRHAARQVLDKIAEAGVGVSEHKDPVYVDLEKIVKKLLREFKEDLGAFDIALQELIELTESIYRKAREKEEISQQEIKQNHARDVVLQEIRKITIGKELPEGIRTLVLKVWPSIMYNHYLHNGKANDEWVEMLMILAKIIESSQPLTSVQQQEELGLSYEDIVRATRDKLSQLGKSERVVNRVVGDLKATFENLMKTEGLPDENAAKAESLQAAEEQAIEEQATEEQAIETEAPVSGEETVASERLEQEKKAVAEEDAFPAIMPEQEPEAEPEEDPEVIARRKIDRLPNDIQPGAWFIVYNGEDKPVRRLKLAVVLMQDATLVFVDHLGNVVIEKDAEEFNTELEKGLSGMIMQHSVFDHALRTALGTITR